MTKTNRKFVVGFTTCSLLLMALDAYAHRPVEGDEEGVTTIPNTSASFAYSRELYDPDDVHIYQNG